MTDQPERQIVSVNIVRDDFSKLKTNFAEIAPRQTDWRQICGAIVAAMRMNPKLRGCTRPSYISAAYELIAYGLVPSSIRNLAHLIPFHKGSDKLCQVVVGYQGYMTMAYRHPKVYGFEVPKFVYPNDEFEYTSGTETKIVHRENFAGRGDDEWHTAYVVARVQNMPPVTVVWPREQFLKLKASIFRRNHWKDDASVPWNLYFEPMCSKTLLIRACNPLPKLSYLELALGRESQFEAGLWEPITRDEIKPPAIGDENGNADPV